MAITSRIKPIQSFGEMTINDWKQAGLIKESAIKPIMITIEKGLILNALGQLAQADALNLHKNLQAILG
jgi:mRNA interferase MazF